MAFVLDPSVTLAWAFEDENSDYANHVLELLDHDTAMVPGIWPLEVANAMLTGERRRRIREADVVQFLALIRALPITLDITSIDRATGPILNLARAEQLTSYDAAYLELAMREGLPLATQDGQLRDAATRVGVLLVE